MSRISKRPFLFTGGNLSDPEGIVFGPDHNLNVANGDGSDVVRFNGTTGAFIDNFVTAGSGGLGGPTFLVFHAAASGAVPEPSMLGIVGLGLAGLAAWKRKSKKPLA